MPIVLDPNVANPGTGVSATSSDGVLTVYLDVQYAGVVLAADFSALSTKPSMVRFYRNGVTVRSGDPAWSPGGYGRAYDHEAPLGVASSWTVVPIFADGTTGTASTPAAITIPFDISDKRSVWLKSIDNPGLSMRLLPVLPLPTFTRAANVLLQRVPGSAYPLGTIDARSARTAEYHFLTTGEDERDDLELLLDSGVLLLQHSASHHTRDIYCVAGDTTEDPAGAGMEDADREWVVPITEVRRPPTIDSPLYIPGRSYDEQLLVAPTYADRLSAWPTYDDALFGNMPTTSALFEETDSGGGEGGL